ncbi:MAG: DUF2012 domain-containing protein [Bacteroidota bacterium]
MSCFSLSMAQDKPANPSSPINKSPVLVASNPLGARTGTLTGSIQGLVVEAGTELPVVGVHVHVKGTDYGAVTHTDGTFVVNGVPVGRHTVEARMLGFSSQEFRVDVRRQPTPFVTVALEEAALQLDGIVIKPENTTPETATLAGLQHLPAYKIARAKAFDEDIYRTVTRTPGIVANDFSSRFMIRGGAHDEVLVTLDGLELNDPFHLKDFGGGGISIVDADAVGAMTLSTGGYTADLGDRMSGVLQINSVEPAAGQAVSRLGLSLMNARIFSQGTLGNGNTQWVFSGRRGYLDFLLDLMQTYPSYSPQFFDGFAKLSHKFGEKHTVALEGLVSGDQFKYLDVTDPNDQVHTNYGNGYVWLNWQSVWRPRLFSETVVSTGKVWRMREGVDIRRDSLVNFETDDTRKFAIFQFKQDWTLQQDEHRQARWGFSLKQQRANYRYSSGHLIQQVAHAQASQKVTNRYAERHTATDPAGVLFNMYGSQQVRLAPKILATAGLRTGYASWSSDFYLDPRLNLQYSPSSATLIRGAWGFFHQPQGIAQLYVEDEEQRYHKAERSRHIILGLDHTLRGTWALKLDLYDKQYANVRPRYVSPAGDVAAFFPEIDKYRTYWKPDETHTRGVEVSVVKTAGRVLTGAAGYTLSQAFDIRDGQRFYKDHDQRQAALVDFNIQPTKQLLINLSWQYHAGWRHAEAAFDVTYQQGNDVLFDTHFGARNAARYPAYHKMDLRIARQFYFKNQSVAAFLEIQNLYNRQNVRRYRYEPAVSSDGEVSFLTHAEAWLPRLPTLGLKWEISH